MGRKQRLKRLRREQRLEEAGRQPPERPVETDAAEGGPARVRPVVQVLVAVVVAAALFLVYANSLDGEFVFDDENNIVENRHVQITEISWDSLRGAALDSPHPRRWVAYVSFALNHYAHRYEPYGYRVVNVLIHLVTGVLLYYLVLSTLSIKSQVGKYARPRELALFTALLWLFHPLGSQSVAYVVQRMNSLSAMFYILCFLLYVRARLASRNAVRWPLFGGCLVAGLLAIGSKEIAATLPIFLALYEWYFFQDLEMGWLKRNYARLLAAVGAAGAIAFLFLGSKPFLRILGGYRVRDFTLMERVLTQPRVVLKYVTQVLLPHPDRLNLEHNVGVSQSLFDPPTTGLALLVIVAAVWAAARFARKERLASFCVLWFFGNLAIESSVIALEMVFEHRTYLPSMGLLLLIVMLLQRLIRQNRLRLGVMALLLVLMAAWTHQRSGVWGDPVALYRDIVKKVPTSARGHGNLGTYLLRRGERAVAISHLEEAIRLNPRLAATQNTLGQALAEEGRFAEAEEHLVKAAELHPRFGDALSNLGGVLVRQGRHQEALGYLQKAAELDPDVAQTHFNLGVALDGEGRMEEALDHYREAIRLDPDYVDARDNLGVLLFRQGDSEEALRQFEEAVRTAPEHANARAHLGIALLQQDRPEEAVEHLAAALRIVPDHEDAGRYYEHALRRAGVEPETGSTAAVEE